MTGRLLLAAMLLAAAAPAARAQEPVPPARPDTAPPPLRLKPASAMLRSMALPGWGQFALGERTRGIVYLAGHGANTFMLTKTLLKLADARSRVDDFRAGARDSLRAAARTDTALARQIAEPRVLELLVDSTEAVVGAESLVQSRERQREDWITLTLFWMLASGADAFVAAHLSDFPGDVAVEPRREGGFLLRFSLPVRWPLPARRPW